MISLFDTNSFGATFVGLIALGTTYQAHVAEWALLVLPLSVAAGYWLIRSQDAEKAAASKGVRTKATDLLIYRAAFETARRRVLAGYKLQCRPAD
jgi:hypothetical protein